MSRLMILLIITLLGGPADGHDWYPTECCSGKDCSPYDPAQITETPQGYRLHDGTVIPYGEARQSKDGRFHRCDYSWSPHKLIYSNGRPCFFVPGADG